MEMKVAGGNQFEQTGQKLNAFCWIRQPAEIEESSGVTTMVATCCCLDPGALLGLPCSLKSRVSSDENTVQTQLCHQKAVYRQLVCGKAAGYAQDRMCKSDFSVDQPFFLQHPCKLDTILVQPVRADVNR